MNKAVGNLTECPICMERLENPKLLPCYHTFCCSCIERLYSEHHGRFPCPLCRSLFYAPSIDCCARLPTDVYAEELVHACETLEETQEELDETKEALQKAVDEKTRLRTVLAETEAQLAEVIDHSAQDKQRLVSRVEKLKRQLSAAELKESGLHEMQREMRKQLRDAKRKYEAAKIEAENCERHKDDTEASLVEAIETSNSLRQQLQQIERETNKRLQDAELRYRKAMGDAEASLAKEKQSSQKLQQELQRIQRETSKQLQDAELRHQKAMGDAEASLAKEKQSS